MLPWPLLCLLLEPVEDGEGTAASTEIPATTRGGERHLDAAILSVDGLPRDAFIEALSLRSAVQVVDRAPPDSEYVFVGIRPDPNRAEGFLIELIVSDGRAFDRRVDAAGDQAARIVATTVAQLLAAVDDGAVHPDRSDVPLPTAEPDPPTPPAPEPAPAPNESAPLPEERPPSPSPPPMSLGLTFGGGAALGLPDVEGIGAFAGGGGLLGLDLRLTRGALVGLSVRWAGSRQDALGLLRTRFVLGAGYNWRSRRFEIPVALSAVVEPWWVLQGGQPVSFADGSSAPPLVVGGSLRFAPSMRIPLSTGPKPSQLTLGPRLELDVTTAPGQPLGGARIVQTTAMGSDPTFRVGGIELWLGLDLTVWFDVAKRPDKRLGRGTRGDHPPIPAAHASR